MKKNDDGTRLFGAKIDGFENKIERAFLKRALKAYLAGHKMFAYGRNPKTLKPNYYPVPEVLS